MEKIQKTSRYLIVIFNILLLLIPTFITSQWLFLSFKNDSSSYTGELLKVFEQVVRTPEGPINLSTVAWTPFLSLLGLTSDLIGSLAFFISLFLFKKLFQYYQDGEIFSARSALIYRTLGLLYLLDAFVLRTISQTLMVLAVTLSNDPGHRYIAIFFDNTNFSSLFYGSIILVISWVMMEASNIHNEHKLTI